MSILAEANTTPSGRWVIMPRRGQRFLGPKDRTRARARRRRRQIFTLLLEMTGLTLLIGAFPPFRVLLYGSVVLGGLVVVYALLLVRIRAVDRRRARLRRAMVERYGAPGGFRPPLPARSSHAGNGRAIGVGRNGNGNGHSGPSWEQPSSPVEAGIRILDDDVHVIVRTSGEIDREAVMASASR